MRKAIQFLLSNLLSVLNVDAVGQGLQVIAKVMPVERIDLAIVAPDLPKGLNTARHIVYIVEGNDTSGGDIADVSQCFVGLELLCFIDIIPAEVWF